MSSKNESLTYSGVYHGDSNIDSAGSKLWPQTRRIRELPDSIQELPYSSCLIDHSGRQFVCFHEQCRDQSSCIKNSVPNAFFDFRAMHVHPDDKTLFCGKIFPDILKFIEQIPALELPDYRLSFNHRYIRTDGSISQFLQEGTLLISEDNHLPVLNLRVFTEIGDFKTDDTMILSVFRFLPNQGYQKVWSKVYENNHHQQLSLREMEIIKLCLEGLSSKMIAHKLNLSIHTVKNHKRNCMEKTLTHNISELINLCIRRHWL